VLLRIWTKPTKNDFENFQGSQSVEGEKLLREKNGEKWSKVQTINKKEKKSI
jgi:hypothetical protein